MTGIIYEYQKRSTQPGRQSWLVIKEGKIDTLKEKERHQVSVRAKIFSSRGS